MKPVDVQLCRDSMTARLDLLKYYLKQDAPDHHNYEVNQEMRSLNVLIWEKTREEISESKIDYPMPEENGTAEPAQTHEGLPLENFGTQSVGQCQINDERAD